MQLVALDRVVAVGVVHLDAEGELRVRVRGRLRIGLGSRLRVRLRVRLRARLGVKLRHLEAEGELVVRRARLERVDCLHELLPVDGPAVVIVEQVEDAVDLVRVRVRVRARLRVRVRVRVS